MALDKELFQVAYGGHGCSTTMVASFKDVFPLGDTSLPLIRLVDTTGLNDSSGPKNERAQWERNKKVLEKQIKVANAIVRSSCFKNEVS